MEKKVHTVGVFCASSQLLPASYYEQAEAVGRALSSRGLTVVFGGANCGMMEALARGVCAEGGSGRLVGVVPGILHEQNRVSRWLHEEVPCADLAERKQLMMERSDCFVALPGGVGTLDEVFTVASNLSIGFASGRVILYDTDGFWNPLWEWLQTLRATTFIKQPLETYFLRVSSPEELLACLG